MTHIVPYVLLAAEKVVAYGEIWQEKSNEVELGRLIVAPAHRMQGFGLLLIERLLSVAELSGCRKAWVRVFPTNTPAQRCYEAASFVRVAPEVETMFNAGQRHQFLWMTRRLRE